MKSPLSFTVIRSAALVLAVAIGISAQAATTQPTTNAPAGKVGKKKAALAAAAASSKSEAGLLDEAYSLLASADHDYKGHRAEAMHRIEEAAKALGSKLSGGGKGHEKQGTSDSQVKSAQSLLEQAVGGLKGKPHRHVEEALKQLNIALSVK